MSEFRDEITGYFGKKIGLGLVALVGLLVLGLIFSSIFSFWPFSTAAGLVKQVTAPEKIISDYQWFYDQYGAIQAMRANLRAFNKDDPSYTGSLQVLNMAIADYNARSRQHLTRSLWKAPDLPESIPLEGVSP